MGNSEPAKNHGMMATAGVRPTYSSWDRSRNTRISAIPATVAASNSAAAANHARPAADVLSVAPRTTATTTSTVTCSAVIVSVAKALPNGTSHRGRGAARS